MNSHAEILAQHNALTKVMNKYCLANPHLPPPSVAAGYILDSSERTRSLWHLTRREGADLFDAACEKRVVPSSASTVIIGAGIAGTSTAWWLCEMGVPARDICVLEAGAGAGIGASGRNGGHCWCSPRMDDDGDVSRLKCKTRDGVEAMLHHLDDRCEFKARGGATVLDGGDPLEEKLKDESEWVSFCNQHIPEARGVELFGEEECAARLIPCTAATLEPLAASLHPQRLLDAMWRSLSAKGVDLCSKARVVEVSCLDKDDDNDITDQGEAMFEVHTTRGTVKARRVVYAINAYMATLLPELAPHFEPFRGQVSAFPSPSSHPVCQHSLTSSSGFLYSIIRDVGEGSSKVYSDATIVLGGGRFASTAKEMYERGTWDDTRTHPGISLALKQAMQTWYNVDASPSPLVEWSGIMAATSDERAVAGELPPRPRSALPPSNPSSSAASSASASASATPSSSSSSSAHSSEFVIGGFNGNGMAIAFELARRLAVEMQASLTKDIEDKSSSSTGDLANEHYIPLQLHVSRFFEKRD